MGKRGPKGKSPELESKQGFPGRRKSQSKAALQTAKPSPLPPLDDIQDELSDSPFVQPPGYLGKRERAVWAEIFVGPNARLWYKLSDHNIIARYCVMVVQWRRMSQTPPRPTYEVHRPARTNSEGKPVGLPETLIKKNPEFDAWLALGREIGNIEARVGMNPDARVALERRGLAPGQETPKGGQQPADARKPSGPIGLLKSPNKMN